MKKIKGVNLGNWLGEMDAARAVRGNRCRG